MDMDSLKYIDQHHHPLFIVPLGNQKLLNEEGINNVVELDWFETHTIHNIDFILTPAQHWSARGLFDRCDALWGGFFIKTNSQSLFFAGDTGYGSHFKQIYEKIGAPDIALLPIGAYEPRWFMKDAHMNPDDAVLAHIDLHAKRSIPIHYGTFQLTNEGIDDPIKDLKIALKKHSITWDIFKIMNVGQTESFQ
jgi:L-ascorbate metabolism protein UlaG (beta-lactamase superfamily)